jgi:hypothetical protein
VTTTTVPRTTTKVSVTTTAAVLSTTQTAATSKKATRYFKRISVISAFVSLATTFPYKCPNPVSDSLYEGEVFSSTGDYIKQLCAIDKGLTQEQAYQYCFDYGMRLYVINSEDDQNELFRITTEHFGTNNDWKLFIDGVCSNSEWFYKYTFTPTPAYSGLRFTPNVSWGCESLCVHNRNDGLGFNLGSFSEESRFWFVCEKQLITPRSTG